MRIIGRIEPKLNDQDELLNADYAGGRIVELTNREVHILERLQDSIDGNSWDYSRLEFNGNPADMDMSDLFQAVVHFVQVQYAINDFKSAIARVEDIVRQVND